jgi:hypothetical protein
LVAGHLGVVEGNYLRVLALELSQDERQVARSEVVVIFLAYLEYLDHYLLGVKLLGTAVQFKGALLEGLFNCLGHL